MVTAPGIDELNGFVVFEPRLMKQDELAIYFSKTVCRFSSTALAELKDPEALVAFFDYNNRRLMLQPAKKTDVNALVMQSVPNSSQTRKRHLICGSFLKEVRRMAGVEQGSFTLPGHKAAVKTPTLIFSFDDVKEKQQ